MSPKKIVSWLRKPAKVAAAILLSGAALIFIFTLFATSINNEYGGRGAHTLVAQEAGRDSPFTITLFLHRIIPEENAVEVSLSISAEYDQLPREMRGLESCGTLVVDVRDYSQQVSPRAFVVSCKRNFWTNITGTETPRFTVPASASVEGFPFDDLQVATFQSLYTLRGLEAARQQTIKLLPGRAMLWDGDRVNGHIVLSRPFNDKVLILVSAGLFLLLTTIVTWKLFFSGGATSGVQEIVAVAGYIVAAASFRDLLGVTHTNGTSAFEILVFGLPMCLLATGVAFSAFRPGQTDPDP